MLDDEGIDYALTDEASGRGFTAVVTFPLPTGAVEPVLSRLRDAGIEEDSYTVVVDAETVISRRFQRLQARFEETEENGGSRIAREELHAQATELEPEFDTYLAMTIISAVVATAGVLVDSPAVVVGSMVIAPLVGPAMATSVGSVVDDRTLFRRGVRLQMLGIVAATVSAAAFAFLVKLTGIIPPTLDPFTLRQFAGRLTPDFLSLAVALGAGAAGAISITSGVSIALVGVMIAAALVPPIAVVGIGIAWNQPMTVVSSGVLVLVNVLSINLSALAVLWYRGYRPENWLRQDEVRSATFKRIAALAVAITILSVFLGGVTYTSHQTEAYERDIEGTVHSVVESPPHEGFSVLDVRIEYDSQLPFREPERVVVTVGRPVGETSPELATTLFDRLESDLSAPPGVSRSDPPLDVQVRYVDVQAATDDGRRTGSPAGGSG